MLHDQTLSSEIAPRGINAWQRRYHTKQSAWWRHQMGTFSALLAICTGNSPVTGEFPTQRPVTRSFDIFFNLRLNERLSKQSWRWWFETPLCPIWRHRNGALMNECVTPHTPHVQSLTMNIDCSEWDRDITHSAQSTTEQYVETLMNKCKAPHILHDRYECITLDIPHLRYACTYVSCQ